MLMSYSRDTLDTCLYRRQNRRNSYTSIRRNSGQFLLLGHPRPELVSRQHWMANPQEELREEHLPPRVEAVAEHRKVAVVAARLKEVAVHTPKKKQCHY